MALLEIKDVAKGYGEAGPDRAEILAGINLTIQQGEFVSIVGYSGSGKTTLINLIAGLIQPDSGTVTFKGSPVREAGPERAVVFQNYSLLPWLTVFGNVALAVDQLFSGLNRKDREAHVMKYIRMVNLEPARDKYPSELSGGMRQRTSLARSLAMEPNVLLLDEPLGALDALTRATLQEEIIKIWEADRKTMVLITNDVDEGILMADRIIPLSAGPQAKLGPALTVDIPRPRDRKAINHEPMFQQIRREVIRFLLHSHKDSLDNASDQQVTLPDVLPEDLTLPPRFWHPKRPPLRRADLERAAAEREAQLKAMAADKEEEVMA
ncbi:MAG: ABC transporter ATP-binding protein [Verrucomicrobiae bacterium]|jgi:nitrate/nitrite transport system ATP-binding protein|nr:ABC transporter ATP-binding protein [Verrucomicrobiae bacterium]